MLTPDQLRDVIAQGEQLDVEFRGESEHAVSDADLVETVSCLANARGGLVLVGVEDDGRITGARRRQHPA
jgi:ATP-dependent DNA helicase RecG